MSALSWCSVGGNKDERFASNPARVKHRELLLPLIAEALQAWRGLALAEALEAVGVPCGPINNLAQVFADRQVQAREMRVDVAHPGAGSVPQVRHPVRFSGDATVAIERRAPASRATPLISNVRRHNTSSPPLSES